MVGFHAIGDQLVELCAITAIQAAWMNKCPQIAAIPARLERLAKATGSKNIAQRLRISNAILMKVQTATTNWADITSKIAQELILRFEKDAKEGHDRKKGELEKLSKQMNLKNGKQPHENAYRSVKSQTQIEMARRRANSGK